MFLIRPADLVNTFVKFQCWEDLVCQYERSKSSVTTTTAVDEDIKTAALEALVPSEVGTTSCHEPCTTDHVRVSSK